MNLSDSFNTQQRQAILHTQGPLLVLAGAGSGKTRVLTHRIAYLIEHCNIAPWQILALTFTNKAANEMRERIEKIIGPTSAQISMGTFHSICVRILRRHIDLLGYSNHFTIYDTDDQKTVLREVYKSLHIDPKHMKERLVQTVISNAKNDLLSPKQYMQAAQGDFLKTKYAMIYEAYQKRLKENNALDFDDLIFQTILLFQKEKEVLQFYQKKFAYILVDEYQDTNASQFELIRLLASGENDAGKKEYNICVVGDDDQSIYKFRGANIYHILNFEKQFPNTKVIKLEQNYRSTKTILEAANDVIQNNHERKNKTLWTDNETGEPISFSQFETEYEEAEHIACEIEQSVRTANKHYQDFAILYRTNAQSRILEEKLILKNIPYKIVGAIHFYQRKEIKDLLCYLKAINNTADDLAVKRIINVPRRGIGATTIERVSTYAAQQQISFYQALQQADQIPQITRGVQKVQAFIQLMESFQQNLQKESYSLQNLIQDILNKTGYQAELEDEGKEEATNRIENIDELKNKIILYETNTEDATLAGFLEEVSLVADIDTIEDSTDVVILMTLHSAKGLEFPYVYLAGMEDGVFPGYLAITSTDPSELEEERRLCYVGITRAMKCLHMSAAKQRMIRGETQWNKPSRFLSEIPRHLLHYTTPAPKKLHSIANQKSKINFSFASPSYTQNIPVKQFPSAQALPPTYQTGDCVMHVKFGKGIVTDITQGGRDFEVTVNFEKVGQKKLLASFAKLKKVDA